MLYVLQIDSDVLFIFRVSITIINDPSFSKSSSFTRVESAAVSRRWFLSPEWKGKALLKQALWSRGTAHAGALIGGQLNASKLAYKNQVKCKRNLNLI